MPTPMRVRTRMIRGSPTADSAISHGRGDEPPGNVCLRALLQFGDSRCRSAASRSQRAGIGRSRRASCPMRRTLGEFARTAVNRRRRGDGIALIARPSRGNGRRRRRLVRIDKQCEPQALRGDANHDGTHGQEIHGNGRADASRPRCSPAWLERIDAGNTPGCLSRGAGRRFSRRKALSDARAFVVHQYGVASMLGAALRLMRISHVDTQAMLFDAQWATRLRYEAAPPRSLATCAASRR